MKSREEPSSDVKKAKVTVPLKKGHKGPYFDAECDIGIVTVSLDRDVWQEDVRPDGGNSVLIWDIREKTEKGWRAYKARLYRPGDEELFGKKG